jgi:hypothetical protein
MTDSKSKAPGSRDAAAYGSRRKKGHATPARGRKVSPAPARTKDAAEEPEGRGFMEPELLDRDEAADSDIERC